MPREDAIVFRDIVGKLDVLNVECDKCGRRGLYHFDRLIERYGIDAKLFDAHGRLSTQAGDEPQRRVRCAMPGSAACGVSVGTPCLLAIDAHFAWAEWRHTLFCFLLR